MLGEEKIIVQDRGIDAGIAALMQNANNDKKNQERDQWMSLLPATENQKNSQSQSIDPLLVTVLLGLLFPQIKTKQSRSSKINTIFTKLKKTLSLNVTKR